ncbi:hypothetical protein NQP46_30590 [Streptomyces albus]|nr:hypothetical protein NQP46_30590 [Streptomyces albus]
MSEQFHVQRSALPKGVPSCGDRQVERAWHYEKGQPPFSQLLTEFAEKPSHYGSLCRISTVSAEANLQRGKSSSTS